MVCELHGEEGCLRVRLPPPLALEILFLLRNYGRDKNKRREEDGLRVRLLPPTSFKGKLHEGFKVHLGH